MSDYASNNNSTDSSSGGGTLDRYFKISERGSTVATEIRAGITTFLTMGYILFINPQILSLAGIPAADVAIATALGAAIATIIMGLYANFPFVLAPGMGLNAYFTFGVVQGLGVSWQVALTAVFVEGLIFLALSRGGVRTLMINSIPHAIKIATTVGIGLFLAIIGLQNVHLVVDHPATLVTLGDVTQPSVYLALLGVVLTGALLVKRIKGAILIGILVLTVIAWYAGLAPMPETFFSLPALPQESLFALDFSQVFTATFMTVVIAFMFVDIFDTSGTLIGVGRLAGFLDKEGRLPGSDRAFSADAVGTSVGALFGTSTVTTYIESATGVEEGGRTGLTAVVSGLLFLLALFFIPLVTAVPALATAPALIIVGTMMMAGAADLEWNQMDDAIPAFLTVVIMPLTYSIANGITIGLVCYVVLKLITGKIRDINPVLFILALLLAAYYADVAHLLGWMGAAAA
ncbi:MAG: NCS2 family permease [Candidatus Competibacteraceae bacterium]|nr:NCS2 family permease [Candidatus Competibacteraceae bacterium]